jgi:hypothetical protein
MTNPTSNFGWQMPEATDLVTNLPADFEVFGQAVDTDFADLLGGTTGQVLKKNTNADLDFVWGADSAGMTNPMTTTGDIIYSSPGSTPVRLGIGSAAQVLTVTSGVPSWVTPAGASAPGLVLISRVVVTASSGQNFDNVFSSTYENYKIIANLSASGADVDMKLRVGGVNTSSNYLGQRVSGTGSTAAAQAGPSNAWTFGELGTGKSIMSWDIAGPFLTQQTAMIGSYGFSTNAVRTYYNAQTDSTSFTSFNLAFSAVATGTVAIYGYTIV